MALTVVPFSVTANVALLVPEGPWRIITSPIDSFGTGSPSRMVPEALPWVMGMFPCLRERLTPRAHIVAVPPVVRTGTLMVWTSGLPGPKGQRALRGPVVLVGEGSAVGGGVAHGHGLSDRGREPHGEDQRGTVPLDDGLRRVDPEAGLDDEEGGGLGGSRAGWRLPAVDCNAVESVRMAERARNTEEVWTVSVMKGTNAPPSVET